MDGQTDSRTGEARNVACWGVCNDYHCGVVILCSVVLCISHRQLNHLW